ncbi:hypothetical protein [Ochrobactrum sp. 19YEA23]
MSDQSVQLHSSVVSKRDALVFKEIRNSIDSLGEITMILQYMGILGVFPT